MIPQITPNEAFAKMQNTEINATYVDVRTVAEFEAGHPAQSFNLPVKFKNDDTGAMEDNSNFVVEFSERFPDKSKHYVLGCRSGARSNFAGSLLQQAGYENLYNVVGGYVGTMEDKGWSQCNLPTEEGASEDGSY